MLIEPSLPPRQLTSTLVWLIVNTVGWVIVKNLEIKQPLASRIVTVWRPAGLELISSVVDLNGVLDVYNNTTGILARQSSLITDSIIGQCNTKGAVELEESTFQYNKNLLKPTGWPLVDKGINYRLTKNFFHANGQHIKATSSKIKPSIK